MGINKLYQHAHSLPSALGCISKLEKIARAHAYIHALLECAGEQPDEGCLNMAHAQICELICRGASRPHFLDEELLTALSSILPASPKHAPAGDVHAQVLPPKAVSKQRNLLSVQHENDMFICHPQGV